MINVINHRDIEMVQRTMIGYEAFSLPNYLEEQVRDRKTRMRDLFAAASPGMVDCRFIVKNGIPYWELLEAIKEEKPGLMVLSTKGRSNLADVLVGSTARRIYRRSPVPLLTIPASFDELP
jgi:nucleotide-binding universal stress UspA family protein